MRNFIFLVVCVFSLNGFGNTYYIPHIHTGNDSWESYLVVDNLSDGEILPFQLVLYNSSGSVSFQAMFTLDPDSSRAISLRELGCVCGEVSCTSNELRFRESFIAKDSDGGGTAEFELPSSLMREPVLSLSNYYDELTWSGFALYNGSDEEAEVDVSLMTTSGVTNTSFTLSANTKKVNLFEDEFGVDPANLYAVRFATDNKCLTAITISGKDSEKLLFTGCSEGFSGWTVEKNYGESSSPDYRSAGIVVDDDVVYHFCSYGRRPNTEAFLNAYDRETGEELYSSSLGFTGIYPVTMKESADGAFLVVCGFNADYDVWVARVRKSDGNVRWSRALTELFNARDAYAMSFRLDVASSGESVAVVYWGASTDGERYLLAASNGAQLDNKIHYRGDYFYIPTHIFFTNGEYYYFRSDCPIDSEATHRLNLYHHGEASLAGGGRSYTSFSSGVLFLSENSKYFFAKGSQIVDNKLYFVILFGMNHYSSYDGQAAIVVPAVIDLDTGELYISRGNSYTASLGTLVTVYYDEEISYYPFAILTEPYSPFYKTQFMYINRLSGDSFSGGSWVDNMDYCVCTPVIKDGFIYFSKFIRTTRFVSGGSLGFYHTNTMELKKIPFKDLFD